VTSVLDFHYYLQGGEDGLSLEWGEMDSTSVSVCSILSIGVARYGRRKPAEQELPDHVSYRVHSCRNEGAFERECDAAVLIGSVQVGDASCCKISE
jgi:hypothetical protein